MSSLLLSLARCPGIVVRFDPIGRSDLAGAVRAGTANTLAKRGLRLRGLVELDNRYLTIRDRAGLEGIAEFDPSYLYTKKQSI